MGRLDRILQLDRSLRKFHVYCISDMFLRPVYVGSSIQPAYRHKQHKISSQHPALRSWLAINSYSHTFEVLDSFHTREDMLGAEHEYIQYLEPRFNRVW